MGSLCLIYERLCLYPPTANDGPEFPQVLVAAFAAPVRTILRPNSVPLCRIATGESPAFSFSLANHLTQFCGSTRLLK